MGVGMEAPWHSLEEEEEALKRSPECQEALRRRRQEGEEEGGSGEGEGLPWFLHRMGAVETP